MGLGRTQPIPTLAAAQGEHILGTIQDEQRVTAQQGVFMKRMRTEQELRNCTCLKALGFLSALAPRTPRALGTIETPKVTQK